MPTTRAPANALTHRRLSAPAVLSTADVAKNTSPGAVGTERNTLSLPQPQGRTQTSFSIPPRKQFLLEEAAKRKTTVRGVIHGAQRSDLPPGIRPLELFGIPPEILLPLFENLPAPPAENGWRIGALATLGSTNSVVQSYLGDRIPAETLAAGAATRKWHKASEFVKYIERVAAAPASLRPLQMKCVKGLMDQCGGQNMRIAGMRLKEDERKSVGNALSQLHDALPQDQIDAELSRAFESILFKLHPPRGLPVQITLDLLRDKARMKQRLDAPLVDKGPSQWDNLFYLYANIDFQLPQLARLLSQEELQIASRQVEMAFDAGKAVSPPNQTEKTGLVRGALTDAYQLLPVARKPEFLPVFFKFLTIGPPFSADTAKRSIALLFRENAFQGELELDSRKSLVNSLSACVKAMGATAETGFSEEDMALFRATAKILLEMRGSMPPGQIDFSLDLLPASAVKEASDQVPAIQGDGMPYVDLRDPEAMGERLAALSEQHRLGPPHSQAAQGEYRRLLERIGHLGGQSDIPTQPREQGIQIVFEAIRSNETLMRDQKLGVPLFAAAKFLSSEQTELLWNTLLGSGQDRENVLSHLEHHDSKGFESQEAWHQTRGIVLGLAFLIRNQVMPPDLDTAPTNLSSEQRDQLTALYDRLARISQNRKIGFGRPVEIDVDLAMGCVLAGSGLGPKGRHQWGHWRNAVTDFKTWSPSQQRLAAYIMTSTVLPLLPTRRGDLGGGRKHWLDLATGVLATTQWDPTEQGQRLKNGIIDAFYRVLLSDPTLQQRLDVLIEGRRVLETQPPSIQSKFNAVLEKAALPAIWEDGLPFTDLKWSPGVEDAVELLPQLSEEDCFGPLELSAVMRRQAQSLTPGTPEAKEVAMNFATAAVQLRNQERGAPSEETDRAVWELMWFSLRLQGMPAAQPPATPPAPAEVRKQPRTTGFPEPAATGRAP